MANCYPPGQSPNGCCAAKNYTWWGQINPGQGWKQPDGTWYHCGCGVSCSEARRGFCSRWGVNGKCYGDPGGPTPAKDPKCTKDCNSVGIFENIQCRFDKAFIANCGGSDFGGTGLDWFPLVIGGGLILFLVLMLRH